MNSLVRYDQQTDSLWGQLLGRAVAGGLEGTTLEPLPSTHFTWEAWRDLHPDTLVLHKQGGFRSDPYDYYYRSPALGSLGETLRDDRLLAKEFVVGVLVGDQPAAYPFGGLNRTPLINDEVGDEPLLVGFSADSATAAVWSRRLGDRILTFRPVEGSDLEAVAMDRRPRLVGAPGREVPDPRAKHLRFLVRLEGLVPDHRRMETGGGPLGPSGPVPILSHLPASSSYEPRAQLGPQTSGHSLAMLVAGANT